MSNKKPENPESQPQKPSQISAKGWKSIIKRVFGQISEDNIPIVAAGIAFYAFLAIFPAIIALVSIYGLVVDPQTLQQQLSDVSSILPAQSQQLLQGQIAQIVQSSSQALGWGLVVSLLFSLWSANRGTKALFTGLNIAYNEKERRNFLRLNAQTLLFTLGGILVVIISMAVVIAVPVALGNLGLPDWAQVTISIGRWVVLAAIISLSLAITYRYAPDRENAKWRWVSWGSMVATTLWLLGSWGFSYYVSNFGDYNAIYGSLAAVVILLFWFNLSSFVVLLGAEINSESELQTAADTTTGKPKPMGSRGAHDADNFNQAA